MVLTACIRRFCVRFVLPIFRVETKCCRTVTLLLPVFAGVGGEGVLKTTTTTTLREYQVISTPDAETSLNYSNELHVNPN